MNETILNLHFNREYVNKYPLSDRKPVSTPSVIQTLRTYFQYTCRTAYIVFVHTFHNNDNEQCDPAFSLRPHVTFFDEPECTYQNRDNIVNPAPAPPPVGIEEVLGHSKHHHSHNTGRFSKTQKAFRCSTSTESQWKWSI